MEYRVENIDEFRHRICIDLDTHEVDQAFERTYLDFSYRYPLPGHEPGRTPRQAIDNAFGADAVADAVGKELRENALGRVLGLADLVSIGDPVHESVQAPNPGESFQFAAAVDCSPLHPLSSYEPITIRMPEMNENNPSMMKVVRRMRENEALHALQERLQGEVPEIMCDAQEQEQLQAIYAKANAANLPFDAYLIQQRIDPDHFKRELEEQATEAVRRNLALDSWAAHKGFEVTDEQIAESFAKSGVAYPALEEAQWRATGRISQLRQAIRRSAALRDVMTTLIVQRV